MNYYICKFARNCIDAVLLAVELNLLFVFNKNFINCIYRYCYTVTVCKVPSLKRDMGYTRTDAHLNL